MTGLKPLKQGNKQALDISTSTGAKKSQATSLEAATSNKVSTACDNTSKESKDVNQVLRWKSDSNSVTDRCFRNGSGKGDSASHSSRASGESCGVKEVANVVVKYLSPYLKQGSIASKVRL